MKRERLVTLQGMCMQPLYWVHFPHITSSMIGASLNKPHIGMCNNCILSGIIMCVWIYRTSSLKLQLIVPCFIYDLIILIHDLRALPRLYRGTYTCTVSVGRAGLL